jgi:glucose-1-phosphate adenylyltransferase
MKVYAGRIDGLASILPTLKDQKEKYVILADSNIAVNFDFKSMLDAHIASGADVTIAYAKEEIPAGMKNCEDDSNLYYTLSVENGRVQKIDINSQEDGVQNLSMNIYIINRELLVNEIKSAFVRGYVYFERDILVPKTEKLNIQAYEFTGYKARICDMKSYFDENMKLLQDENLDGLFSGNPIYTKVRDDNPTRYIAGAKGKNSLVADGCVIEGIVENCILFRGVKVEKGAKVKNCVLMQDTVVECGANLEYVITDKNVKVSVAQELHGTDSFPVYVAKGQTV